MTFGTLTYLANQTLSMQLPWNHENLLHIKKHKITYLIEIKFTNQTFIIKSVYCHSLTCWTLSMKMVI